MKHKKTWIILALIVVTGATVSVLLLRGPHIQQGAYLLAEIRGHYSEGGPNGLVARLLEERKPLVKLLENLTKAGRDSRITGVVARLGPFEGGWAQAREIHDALADLRRNGKRVIAFLGGEILSGNKEFYVASAADRIYIPPAGFPMLNGLSAQYFFLGGLWERLDIAMEVEQIREYKTFGDMIARRGMSRAHREMANDLIDDVNTEFLTTSGAGRNIPFDEMEAIIDSCPASAEGFVEAGLADAARSFDQVTAELGKGGQAPLVREDTYGRIRPGSLGLGGGEKIAIIHAAGTIVSGKGGGRSVLGMTVGAQPLVRAFRKATSDPQIRAIVFRIDSPGGSPYASDEIWQEVHAARERKPVVASLGDVAASGGYYMASAAGRIFAEPASLTGSIGVVMFKPNISGLLGRLGVGSETLGRGRYSRIMDITKGLDRAELSLIRTQMDGVYQTFLDRVAEGRGMTVEEVDKVAGGRVWTGRQALDIGLVDELGGLGAAIHWASKEAGIEDVDRVEPVYLPEPRGILEEIAALGSQGRSVLLPATAQRTLAWLAPYTALPAGIYTRMTPLLTIR